jgi:uncharacterized phiE125 gp8 family phage protein
MIKLIEESSAMPLSISNVKSYLRVEHNEDDWSINLSIKAATSLVEHEIGRSLLTKVWKKQCRAICPHQGICHVTLPYPPLLEVISVGEIIGSDVRPIKRYVVEWERIVPSVAISSVHNIVEIIYKSGYGDLPSNIPEAIKQSILLIVAEMYEKRGASVDIAGKSVINALLKAHRVECLS